MHVKTCGLFAAAALSAAFGHAAFAMQTAEFKAIVTDTIAQIESGDVDVARLIGLQEQLIAIGVAGAREYAATSPGDALVMNFVADSADRMVAMDLDGIEEAWHEGAALNEIGVDIESLDHFGPVISHMDAIVHPATAILALREYGSTGDRAYLLQVRDELSEVVEHLTHIE